MFHVLYKPLWAAIGEPDTRFRKPAAQGRLIERVMLLDAVLDDGDFTWLGPSLDKRRHFMRYLEGRLEPPNIRTCYSATAPRGWSGTSRTNSRSGCSRTGIRMSLSTW
jgi:hypothetical protein